MLSMRIRERVGECRALIGSKWGPGSPAETSTSSTRRCAHQGGQAKDSFSPGKAVLRLWLNLAELSRKVQLGCFIGWFFVRQLLLAHSTLFCFERQMWPILKQLRNFWERFKVAGDAAHIRVSEIFQVFLPYY